MACHGITRVTGASEARQHLPICPWQLLLELFTQLRSVGTAGDQHPGARLHDVETLGSAGPWVGHPKLGIFQGEMQQNQLISKVAG